MPFPRWLARVNLHFTNRLLGPLACRLPGMGIVVHVGRRTRREYRTPVMIFRRDYQFVIALTYGRNSEWVQDVLAANGCSLETRNRNLRLREPRLFHDDQRKAMPVLVRVFLRILDVSDFLEPTVANDTAFQ
jgi:deazaflavin-dependent oxidoreductase (nitroreductase family)